ncbi:PEP-utilizing enzyme [Ilumatobacter coccineus]|uniref:PEP-utilizing enzyme n=1 Tax=Ilumatobacter coccineus TaxID=467094 RepID=UPI00138B04B3|nr:PEP-utilizing enzyme [Ilumatobacter coccineus]
MSTGQQTASVTWEPPGPGTWELDTAHFDPAVSRPVRDLMTEAMRKGLEAGMELAGAPLAGIDARFVHGRMYLRMVPLVGGSRDLPTPPKPVLWLAARLHPEFRRRTKRSGEALDGRYWMDEFARWEAEWKPELVATSRRLGAVEVAELADDALARHLADVWSHVRAGAELHFRLHVSDLGPISLLLLRSRDAGLDEAEVMSSLAGASPATSAPAMAVAAIAREIELAGATPTSLEAIRSASDRAGELLDEYLAVFGHRISTGYDVRDRTLAELPDVIVASIRAADTSAATADGAEQRGAAALALLVEQIAPVDRDEYVSLVDDARALYGLRDENGPITVQWPLGILRAALLECARRLVAAGRLDDHEHIFDASIDETLALLGGAAAPSPAELAERCAVRMSNADLEPPTVLGRPPEEPPVDILPGRMPEMMRGVLLVTELLERVDRGSGDTALSTGLSGTGIGGASYRGIARVVADADEAIERVEPGDVIVTRLTVPTFNSVLAMAGAVVTEGGGLLSHTAVIARELGIAAVVGVPGALTEIPDGSEIVVDPVAGTVTVL